MPLSFPNSPTNGQIVTISGRQWTFTTGKGWAASGGMSVQGLATTDSPQFAGVNLGHASDTTLSRLAPMTLGVEGKAVPYVFAQSGAALSVGAVTTEAVLATISFAGGEIGPNGYLQVIVHATCTNNANAKTVFVRVGGVAGTQYMATGLTSLAGCVRYVSIFNNNSQSSQKSPSPSGQSVGFGGFSSTGVTSTVNTASAWDLVISAQKAVSGDTLTVEGYQVIVCYGA